MASPASTSALRGQAPQPGAAAAGPARRPASLPGPLPQRPLPPRRTQLRPTAALAPEHVEAAATGLSQLHHLLTLAYEPIVLPCSSMNCGDITYRRWVLPGAAGCCTSAWGAVWLHAPYIHEGRTSNWGAAGVAPACGAARSSQIHSRRILPPAPRPRPPPTPSPPAPACSLPPHASVAAPLTQCCAWRSGP